MIVVEHSKVELDYCTNCHGVWFDTGELEILARTAGSSDVKPLLDAFIKADESKIMEKRRRCPICTRQMRKVDVGAASGGALIDACPQGHGLWFDGGEVEALFKYLSRGHGETAHHKVFHFMDEVFKAR